ncbi:hypothetical protein SEPCBS57363_000059 [Sporothrix epigloea]|uniref:Traf-like signal protein n=1 Tax=Sporothrix epigloea TaxID=1892477 RepID=A0ABP0D2M4_9PEZI
MPPPNTPEESFVSENRLLRNSAIANDAGSDRRRRSSLPAHDEEQTESALDLDLLLHSHNQNEGRSPAPSTVDLQPSDHEADYAEYFRDPTLSEQPHSSSEQTSTPLRSAGATLENSTRNLSLADEQPAASLPRNQSPAAIADIVPEITSAQQLTESVPEANATQTRQKMAKTPKLDWHSLEYVGPYDENLDCPICRAPLVQPVITTCFHIFCLECLATSLCQEARCPIDRNLIGLFRTSKGRVPFRPAPHIISNQLDNLLVRCPNTRCECIVARSGIAHHYKFECHFTKIPCPDPSCNKLVTRRGNEEGSCMHKILDCVYCSKPVELAALEDHYDTDCSQKGLMCAHCLAPFPRHLHGTHVLGCAERRIECKFRASGCAYVAKKKSFGDHEQTCLYGMIMRMNRAHRADMTNMETVLQDSQDRVRKLEEEMASRLPPTIHNLPIVPPPMHDYHGTRAHFHTSALTQIHAQTSPNVDGNDDLSSYYDAAAAGVALVRGEDNRDTQPETPLGADLSLARHGTGGSGGPDNSDDHMNRIVAYIDIFDAKVENLERYLGEVDARQAQMFINELGPLKDQILEMRNSMGHLGMYVRWLMESFRQTTKRSVGLRTATDEQVAGGRPVVATPIGSTVTNTADSPAAVTSNGGPLGVSAATSGLRTSTNIPARRMSDRENPPRL